MRNQPSASESARALAIIRPPEPTTRHLAVLDAYAETGTYELTAKYSIGTLLSYDFGSSSDVYTAVSFQRRFDRFFAIFSVTHDAISGESGFGISIYPEGLGAGASTDALQKVFGGTH